MYMHHMQSAILIYIVHKIVVRSNPSTYGKIYTEKTTEKERERAKKATLHSTGKNEIAT